MKKIIISEKQTKIIKDAMSQVHNKVNAGIMDGICGAVCENVNTIETWYRGFDSRYGEYKNHLLWLTDDIEYAREYGDIIMEYKIDTSKCLGGSIYDVEAVIGYFDYFVGPNREDCEKLMSNNINCYYFQANDDESECLCLWDKSPIVSQGILKDGIIDEDCDFEIGQDSPNDYAHVIGNIEEVQRFTSKNTSINGNKLPSTFTKIKDWKRGTRNLDLGGGKYDNATEFLRSNYDIENLVFDPFNRDSEWNKKVALAIKNGGADTVTVNNVLNVIDDDIAMENVIMQASQALKPNGVAYFKIYEGNKSGIGSQSKDDCYQRHMIAKAYESYIAKYFNNIKYKGDIIIATDPKENENLSVWDFDGKYDSNGINQMKFKYTPNNINESREWCEEFSYTPYIKSILKYMGKQGLRVKPYPHIKLHKNEQSGLFIKTGFYDPEGKCVHLFIFDRHPKDVLRSFVHEMIHHLQNMEGRLTPDSYSGQNISEDSKLQKLEEEAYLKGNIYFRKWTEEMSPNMYEFKKPQPINESCIYEVANMSGIKVEYCSDYESTRELCHRVKDGDIDAISEMAHIMAGKVTSSDILVPIPSRSGTPTIIKILCEKIAKESGATVRDILRGCSRESYYNLKKTGFEANNDFFQFIGVRPENPQNYLLIDNVLDTGWTLKSASDATGIKRCLVFAKNLNSGLNEEVIDEMLTPDEVDLSSFNVRSNLNPRFWKDGHLDSRIRLQLMDVADDFISDLGIDVEPEDYIITGSLANYNWNKEFSDIDLHILIDFSKIDKRIDFVKEYFDDKRKIWNDQHNIEIAGFPVEMYVQDVNELHTSTGVYSLDKDKWIETPSRKKLHANELNKQLVKEKVSKITEKIDGLLEDYNNVEDFQLEDLLEKIEKLSKYVKNLRKRGFEHGGEYNNGNIIFKCLRRNGYLGKLLSLKNKVYDKLKSIKFS